MSSIDRRTLLGGAAAGLVAAGAARTGLTPRLPQAAARAVSTKGATLGVAAAPVGSSGYRRLTAGPGYPLVVREDIVAGQAGRDDRRTGHAAFGQFTDLHMIDAPSPVRVEWMPTSPAATSGRRGPSPPAARRDVGVPR